MKCFVLGLTSTIARGSWCSHRRLHGEWDDFRIQLPVVDFSLGAYLGQNRFNTDLRKINTEILSLHSQFCYKLVSVAAICRH